MNRCDGTLKRISIVVSIMVSIIFTLFLLFTTIAGAADYPQLTGYVTDNANIIDDAYEQKITDLAERINKNTTVEIAVLTIESLGDNYIDNYAVNTFRENGVGKKDNNNGLLILVSKNDRKYRFEVGYGLEGTIPDAMKVPIGDKIITPNFKNGDYGKGIYESMIVIEGLVTNNTEVLSKYGMIQTQTTSGDADTILFTILIGIIIIFAIMALLNEIDTRKGRTESTDPLPYKPYPYTFSGNKKTNSSSSSSSSSSSKRRSSGFNYSGYSGGHTHRSGGGFGGFGGGRSGGGGFGGGW